MADTDVDMEDSQTPTATPGSPADTNDDEDLGERGYWNYPLRGVHESLNVFGRRPLFILKDTWDDRPRSSHSTYHKDYHQVMDHRTKLLLDVYPRKDVEMQPCALVEWRVPAPDKQVLDEFDEMVEIRELHEGALAAKQPQYMLERAMMHANIAGVSDPDEEVLSVFSSDSDGEHEGNDNNRDEEKWTTVYYPLIGFPKNRSKEVREKLRKNVKPLEEVHVTDYPRTLLARSLLEEIERADNTPTISNCP